MNKKDVIKTLDIASFVSAVIATILVLAFEFAGKYILMKYAIVMYAVCFLTLSVMLAINIHTIFSKKEKVEEKQDAGEEENVEEQEVQTTEETSKKKKVMSVVWLVISAAAFVFTCVLLALY